MFVSRKYEQRRKKLRKSLAWWEDQNLDENDSENFCDAELQDYSFDDDTCYIVTEQDIHD